MRILLLKKGRQRNDGSRAIVPIMRERNRKYGPVIAEKNLSTKRDVLVVGPNSAGKSRWVMRYFSHAGGIWPGRPVILLRSINPILSWTEYPALIAHYEQKHGADWRKLRAFERSEALVEWVADTRAVVLLDDAHLLSGRKADVALRCLRGAGVCVVSCSDEGRIPVTVRMAVLARQPQRVALKSEAPYDMTTLVVWVLTLAALGAGAWQLAMVLGGFNLLSRGRRAAKQA